ncbi:MAG: HAD-IIB family hydrolase [Balneolaceae bacterium]|nr:HAD-IIB family hydrolase [Balneolaceae bacterium]
MIKLFVTDLDGCLSEPFEVPNLQTLSKIRALNELSAADESVPPLTLCTGRPQPYAEAVAQWLGIRLPIIFESSGLYKLKDNQIILPPEFSDETKNQIAELQLWIREEIIPQFPGMELEFAKQMDAGVIHRDKEIIAQAYEQIQAYVLKNYPDFEVHKTPVSINTMLSGNNKRKGLEQLSHHIGVDLDDIAYIGDTSGDIPALEIVGYSFAPKHADEKVKEICRVLDFKETEVVLELYKLLIEANKDTKAATEI